MAEERVNKAKPTAVIDMSVLREICEHGPHLRQATWDCLIDCFQPVFPFALVEEAVRRWIPDDSPSSAEGIAGVVARNPQLWMEDVYEIIGQELLDRRLPEKGPGCSQEFRDQILSLKRGTQEAKAWLKQCDIEAKEIEVARRESKKRIVPQLGRKIRQLGTEGDLFREMIAPFLRKLVSADKDLPLVDHWLGQLLKRRHPELAGKFDEAFSELLSASWTRFYLTAGLLQTRFAYFVAPLFVVDRPRFGPPGKFIKIGLNDRTDEEYIVSAFLCQRLLTQDLWMARVMAAFEDGGFWKGQTIYLPKGAWLSNPESFFQAQSCSRG